MNASLLEERISGSVSSGRNLGVAVAAIENGETTFAGGFGATSAEDGALPVTPRTLFAIGSISKTMTAVLIMRLVDAGLVELDRPIVDVVPGFRFSDAARGDRVTLRHVLSHSSGLPSGGKDFGPRDPDALARFVHDELAAYRFVAAPGAVHLYSNTAFVLAAHVAEVITGAYYEQLMQTWVFDPLGMERSTFDRGVAMTYPLALAHHVDDSGEVHTNHRFTDNVSGNPAGFGLSSALDLAALAQPLLHGGRVGTDEFLKPHSVTELCRDQIARSVRGAESHYGLGLYTGWFRGHRYAGHGGMLESYNCFFNLFPDDGAGLILLTNHDRDPATMGIVVEAWSQLLGHPALPPASRPVPPADPGRWEGNYLNVHAGLAHVRRHGDQLALERGAEVADLVTYSDGLARAGDTQVGFVEDEPADHLVLDGDPYQRFDPPSADHADHSRWAEYAGTYQAWDIDPDPLRVTLRDGTLFLRWWAGEVPATPLGRGSFVSSYGLIEFVGEPGRPVAVIAAGATRLVRRESASRG